MIYNPSPLAADEDPDAAAVAAMRAALRDFKVTMRRPPAAAKPAGGEHPRRAEIVSMLTEARASIDRINAAG
jgi:hypothetical protein